MNWRKNWPLTDSYETEFPLRAVPHPDSAAKGVADQLEYRTLAGQKIRRSPIRQSMPELGVSFAARFNHRKNLPSLGGTEARESRIGDADASFSMIQISGKAAAAFSRASRPTDT
jgi:hypothetical protein